MIEELLFQTKNICYALYDLAFDDVQCITFAFSFKLLIEILYSALNTFLELSCNKETELSQPRLKECKKPWAFQLISETNLNQS